METAFLLGAGLGTRLRPLTEFLPKPLVPVFNKPLASYAFDHLIDAGIRRFVVNTHHCPECWKEVFGGDGERAEYRGCPVFFRNEPVLLETGGGLKNIEDLVGENDLLIYNGDILSDLSLVPLLRYHKASGNVVTMGLRSSGGPLQVQCDPETRRVEDIRRTLGGSEAPAYLFTGVYAVSPEIYHWLPPRKITSVIPVFLEMIRAGVRVGGVVLDDGLWMDLGDRGAYLEAHKVLQERGMALSYPFAEPLRAVAAEVGESVELRGVCSIGEGCEIGGGTVVEDSVLWKGAEVAAGSRLKGCVVREGRKVQGSFESLDI